MDEKQREIAEILIRFYSHIIDYSDENACWIWRDGKREGYGKFFAVGRAWQAHRFIYELHVGFIPAGYQLDHLCRNKACVNIKHLEAVRNGENIRRAYIASKRNIVCKNGHIRTEENTYRYPNNKEIQCRTCRNEAARRYIERKQNAN
jgi:hypothetical protein